MIRVFGRRRPRQVRRTASLVSAGLALALSGTLAGCGTGFGAQTSQVYNAPEGTDIRSDAGVQVLSAAIVTDEAGSATLSAGLVGPPGQADTLTSVQVTSDDGAPISAQIAGGTVPIPADELVQTATDAEITIAADDLVPGTLVDVAFAFETSGPVSGPVMVQAREGAYADVEIPAAPSGSATTGGSGG